MHVIPGIEVIQERESGDEVPGGDHVFYLMHKPKGYLCATAAFQPRGPTVFELIPQDLKRPDLIAAGRLDRDTTGALLFGTDGGLLSLLLSPAAKVPKTYTARLRRRRSETEEESETTKGQKQRAGGDLVDGEVKSHGGPCYSPRRLATATVETAAEGNLKVPSTTIATDDERSNNQGGGGGHGGGGENDDGNIDGKGNSDGERACRRGGGQLGGGGGVGTGGGFAESGGGVGEGWGGVLPPDAAARFAAGLVLPDGTRCAPAALTLLRDGQQRQRQRLRQRLRPATKEEEEREGASSSSPAVEAAEAAASATAADEELAVVVEEEEEEENENENETEEEGEEVVVRVVLHEGFYHQVKRMAGEVGAAVVALHRDAFGTLRLDDGGGSRAHEGGGGGGDEGGGVSGRVGFGIGLGLGGSEGGSEGGAAVPLRAGATRVVTAAELRRLARTHLGPVTDPSRRVMRQGSPPGVGGVEEEETSGGGGGGGHGRVPLLAAHGPASDLGDDEGKALATRRGRLARDGGRPHRSKGGG